MADCPAPEPSEVCVIPHNAPWVTWGEKTTLDRVRNVIDDFASDRDWAKFHSPRNVMFSLVGEVGEVADLFRFKEDAECDAGLQGFTESQKLSVANELADVLTCVVRLATVCGIDLAAAWMNKLEVNAAKYPKDTVKGTSVKYTALHTHGGVDSVVPRWCPYVGAFLPWMVCGVSTTLEQCRLTLERFHTERDWTHYHTPRNLVMAMVGEVGELAEHFQWRSDKDCSEGLVGFSDSQRDGVADELSDVFSYLVTLSTACGIDLAAAWMVKLKVNNAKYPAHLVHGIAVKHTEIKRLHQDVV